MACLFMDINEHQTFKELWYIYVLQLKNHFVGSYGFDESFLTMGMI